jgi:DNA (cytosine-5)-methyltransferase 1
VGVDQTEEMHSPTALDLFAGAGGLSLGLHAAGFDVLGAVDSWAPAVETYRLNFDHRVVRLDLSEASSADVRARLNLGDAKIDLVVGGPPCQGFSIQRIGQDKDDRNELVLHFADLVLGVHPPMFLMENVPGLLGKRGRRLAAAFEDRMRGAGYVVETRMLNAVDFGVPQFRRRVFVLGVREDLELLPRFPVPTVGLATYRSVWQAIGDLPAPSDSRVGSADPLHWKTRLSDLNLERIRLIPPGGGFEDLPPELRVRAHRNGAARIGHRNVYGRLAPDKPSATITARFDSFTRGKFGHPYEDRSITLREGARLQTFDDDFLFTGSQEEIAALIGNAVPPLLACAFGRALIDMLRGGSRSSISSTSQLKLDLATEGRGDGADRGVGRLAAPHLPSPA